MPLARIVETCPSWFDVTAAARDEVLGSACIELDDAVGAIEVDLRIRNFSGTVAVQEQVPGTRYPKTCHERHLQFDEHFCIGLNAGKHIASSDHAVVWWGLLKHFLELQRVAERTKRWPAQQEMSHGSAGPHQVAALAAARSLGLEDDYMRMLEGEQSWFSIGGHKITSSGKLSNGWLPCPVGCRDRGKPIPRSRCCNSDSVVTLLREEKARRTEVAKFYETFRGFGDVCCGTMLKCPLREVPNPAAPSISATM
jgi:hypothetical protein